MTRWVLWASATVGLALLTGVLFVQRASLQDSMRRSQLATLTQIETNAVREWRARFGFLRTMQQGDSGSDIRLLQSTLAQGNYLASDDDTGFYGERTGNAVRAFQSDESLSRTGIVDEETRAALNEKYFNETCPRPSLAYPDFMLWNVGKKSLLPQDYEPDGLRVLTGGFWTNGIVCMTEDAASAFERMATDATREGVFLGVTSGFRSADVQRALYDFWHSLEGDQADNEIAPQGGSEHQLGTAIDITGASVGYVGTPSGFDATSEGRWLAANAFRYGFTFSFPKGREAITGYIHEPWHLRYVGTDIAMSIGNERISAGEYLSQYASDIYPGFMHDVSGVDVSASSVLVVYRASKSESTRVLLHKNANVARPVASVVKLLTAIVAERVFSPGALISISAVASREATTNTQSQLIAGDAFSIEDILKLLLIESSNPAARALADAYEYDRFVELMRDEAKRLGLHSVSIINPTGLDPAGSEKPNSFSARDLVVLLREVLDNHPALRVLLETSEARVESMRGAIYYARTTDDLLASDVWPAGIIGGKTGETPKAKQTLVFAVKSPSGDGTIEGVVLESDDRFGEAEKILRWLQSSYDWKL
ncbi:MAG: D-alanyl-D-alanine carboxypeptidase family protein [Patescibacteria group bacterium]|nr:D-alanyl-D-alanine carboxypeptidase family protein [Patescibacteria group bacterium]